MGIMKKNITILAIIVTSLALCIVIGYHCYNRHLERRQIDAYYHDALTLFNDSTPLDDFRRDPVQEGYRFCWLRSFHHPVLITIHVEDKQATLNLKIAAADGSTVHTPGELITNQDIPLTTEQVQELRTLVRQNRFGQEFVSYFSRDFGLDGAVWTIEIKQGKKYHFGYRWSPDSGPLRNIGLHLLKLSQYEIRPNEIY